MEEKYTLEIAYRLFRGHTYMKIAKDLGYSYSAVKLQITYIYRMCDVKSKIGLIILINHLLESVGLKSTEENVKKAINQFL